MVSVEEIKMKYPGADAWQMGDSPELASELADLLPLTSRRNLPRELGVITLSLMDRMFRSA